MKYLMLIYDNEAQFAAADPKEVQQVMGAYAAFTNEVKEKKVYVTGEALQPTSTATTVQPLER